MAVLFQRSPSNPILTAEDMPYPAEAVLNPGVTEQEGEVVLLLRVEERTGRSNIHVARSKDGVSNWRIEKTPLLQHGQPGNRYEDWGCEDARVTWLGSENCWYIVYTAYSNAGAAVGLARTYDLEKVERIGLIFPPNNKDAAIFPDKFGDRWAALHRPDAGGGVENIWIAYSPDLIHWGEPHVVLAEGQGPAWDAVTVGTGPPPLRTRLGWLLLYHGVKMYGGNRVYRVGAALLDADRPYHVLARTPGNLFKPTETYETSGIMPNVVFPTGWVRRGEELWIYYGAADTCIGLTIANIEEILAALGHEPLA
jgi:beta-1,4-mannooligosaccharide/beta-1,4-mannosyl-N-acetylglucosamine phosphorylase